jgi:hypothetical protein
MRGSSRRFVLFALLLAAAVAPASAAASQPAAPVPSRGALAALASPGESLARLWAWVENHLPGHGPGLAPEATQPPAGVPGPGVLPAEGSALDPNG